MQIPRDYRIPHPSRYKLKINTREVWTSRKSDVVDIDTYVDNGLIARLIPATLDRSDGAWFGNGMAPIMTDLLGAIQTALAHDENDEWLDKPDA